MEKATVYNINELVNEIYSQLQDKDYFIHNYRILNNLDDYLQNYCLESEFEIEWQDMNEDDIKEQIFNFFEYDYHGNLDFPIKI